MTTKIADRVKESITTTGTGRILSLGGAESGFRSFSGAGFRDGDTFSYVIEDGSNYEYGEAIYGWNMTQIAHNNKSLNDGATYGSLRGFNFGNSGLKLYALSYTNDAVYQYTLSTAYDISTASYDSKSLSLTGFGDPWHILFKTDGTRCFVFTYTSSMTTVRVYDLSTAWDLSTSTAGNIYYLNASPNLAGLTTGIVRWAHFSSDGLRLIARQNSQLYQFNLSTAWDLDTAEGYTKRISETYPRIYYSNAYAVDDIVQSLQPNQQPYGGITEDGKNLIYMPTIKGLNNSTYDRYSGQIKMINASDISELQPSGHVSRFFRGNLSGGNLTSNIAEGALIFGGNGAYAHDYQGTEIYQAETGFTYGANKITRFPTESSNSNNPIELSVNAKIFHTITEDEFRQERIGVTKVKQKYFYCQTDLNIGTGNKFILPLTYTDQRMLGVLRDTDDLPNFSGVTQRDFPTRVNILSAGVYAYNARLMDDLENASYTQNYSLATTNERGLWFDKEGDKMYTLDLTNNYVRYYSLSSSWDLTTASYTSFFAYSPATSATGLCFNPHGTKMYVIGSDRYLYEYNLSTAWDITSASHTTGDNMYLGTAYYGWFSPQFSGNGKYLYCTQNDRTSSWGNTNYYSRLARFTLGTNWDISTISTAEQYNILSTSSGTYANAVQASYMAPDASGGFFFNNGSDNFFKFYNQDPDDNFTYWMQSEAIDREVASLTGVTTATGMFVDEEAFDFVFFNTGSAVYRKYVGEPNLYTIPSSVLAKSGIYTYYPEGYSIDDMGTDPDSRFFSNSSADIFHEREGVSNWQDIYMALK